MNPVTNSFLYGKGVFTTICLRRGKPVLWDKHMARLGRDMRAVGMDSDTISEKELFDKLSVELDSETIMDGRARITISDETPSPIWLEESDRGTSLQVIVAGPRPMPATMLLTRSPYPINSGSPLAGIKSCNYLENLLAIDEAKRRGFHEAVRVNERGEITGGCMSNIFWMRQGELFTPSLNTRCLPGTTREYIIENLDCREAEEGIGELDRAEAIFLTSAGIGIVEVSGYGSRQMAASGHAVLSLWPPRDTKTRTRTKDDP